MRNQHFAVLGVELLVDPDHPHVLQHGLCGLVLSLFLFRQSVSDQDVDLVAREDKARDAGGSGDRHRNGAHARTEHRCKKAATARRDDLGVADRLARGERIARNPAGKALGGPGAAGPVKDIVLVDPALGPGLPGEVLRLQDLAAGDRAAGNEHKLLRCRGPGQRLRLGVGLLREEGSDQHGGAAGEGKGDEEEDQSACAHCLLPAKWKRILVRYWLKKTLIPLVSVECLTTRSVVSLQAWAAGPRWASLRRPA